MSFSAFPFTHTVRHNCALFLDFPIFFPHFSKVENVGFRFSGGCFFCHSSAKLRDFLTLKWFIFTFISTGFCAFPPWTLCTLHSIVVHRVHSY